MNNEVLDILVKEYLKPVELEWEKNGTSEDFIRGYRSAVETICIKLFGEDSVNILVDKIRGEINGKTSGSEENM